MIVSIHKIKTLGRSSIGIYLGKELCSYFKSNQVVIIRKGNTLLIREGLLSDRKSWTVTARQIIYTTSNVDEMVGKYKAILEDDIIYLTKI